MQEDLINSITLISDFRNKAKLLCHVLNPNKKLKFKQARNEEDQKPIQTTPATPPPAPAPAPPPAPPPAPKEVILEKVPTPTPIIQPPKKSHRGFHRKAISKRYVPSSSEDSESNDSDAEENIAPPPKKKKSNNELVTVNMDDLGDLLSKPNMYYAKKSSPKGTPANVNLVVNVDNEGDDDTTCALCNKTFKKNINLQLHMEKVHQMNAKPLAVEQNIPETHSCDKCSREFVNEQALKKHILEHLNDAHKTPERIEKEVRVEKSEKEKKTNPPKNNPPVAKENEVKATCPHCQQTFRRLYNMKTHINRVHNKVKPFACNRCDKSFATKSDLKQHLSTHGEGRVFKCDLCDRK